jgi:hypothetical protein
MDKLQDRHNHSINCYSKSLSGSAKSTFKICNYRMRGMYNYRAKSTIAVLHFKGWRYNYRGTTYGEEEPLMMKAEEESDVACCCWWRGSHELLMMGKKGDRCQLAAVDEDWRGSRELLRKSSSLLMKRKLRPWALMTGVKKEKEWRLDDDRDCDRDCRRFCGCRLVN